MILQKKQLADLQGHVGHGKMNAAIFPPFVQAFQNILRNAKT